MVAPVVSDPSENKSQQRDFPFYDGKPITISAGQWLVVLVGISAGFACLTLPILPFSGEFGLFIRALLFVLLPLIAFYLITGPHWTLLFCRIKGVDVALIAGFAALNLVISIFIGMLVMFFFGADANATIAGLVGQSSASLELFFLSTIPQLLGEELLTILPFLAILQFAYARMGLSRRKAVVVAWLLSSLLFGLVHLPTYNWNWVQCIVVIGSARLVLTLAYLKTKNIWVSTGAHIINDWSIFMLVILGASMN